MNDTKQGKYATNVKVTVDAPHEQMTRLAGRILEAGIEQLKEEGKDLRIAVMVDNNAGDGGIAIDGFDGVVDAVSSLIVHLEAMVVSQGKKLEFNIIDE